MEGTPPAETGGLFSTAARLLKTLRDVAENRLEIFLIELKEERIRLFDALFLLAVGIVCVMMALLLVTATIVMVFWDTHRLLVLVLAAAVYGAAAATAFIKLRSRLRRWQDFSATLEEFKKDRTCCKPPN